MSVDEQGATVAADEGRVLIGGRYELIGLLGSGGMGNVYKVRDRELDEVVALKALRPEIVGTPRALERFRREVKLARRVTHPNVARVFDIGESGGERLLTMEFVDGESLAAKVHREGRLALPRVIEIAKAICAGVAAAHDAGVIHRDIKPENVLIANDGRVVVTDFGIARALTDPGRTVGFIGTPAYMAPEQIDERTTIDHRADIYAFGVLLFELLTGEPPWRADSVWALAAARLLGPPPDPRTRRPELPAALAQIVTGCMTREVEQRTGSLREVEQMLAELAVADLPDTLRGVVRVNPDAVTTGSDKRVAVLPFENLGPAEEDYIADGLTDDLIDGLSIAPGLRVRSRGVVVRFKGTKLDPRELGRELDVAVVVEGSLRKTPSGYRISTRAISVTDGFQLWARRFDVAPAELLTEIDAIARAIAQALTVTLEMPERPIADSRAVDLYLRARDAYRRCFTGDRTAPLRLYRELLVLTPDDPRALAGRAVAGAAQFFLDRSEHRVMFESAEQAVALGPGLADAHYSLGSVRVMAGDNLGGVAPTREALRLAPTHAEAHHIMGGLFASTNDFDRAIPHLESAMALEPSFEFPYLQLVSIHEFRGERTRVDELLEHARTLGLGVHIPLEIRLCMWRRDRSRALELLATIDRRQPLLAMSVPWVEFVANGTLPPRGVPPGPPGMTMPKVLEWFHLQTDVEVGCSLGDLDDATAALGRYVDSAGEDLGWYQGCELLRTLREHPPAASLSAEIRARAERLRAALDGRFV